jgi:hypothetical protein
VKQARLSTRLVRVKLQICAVTRLRSSRLLFLKVLRTFVPLHSFHLPPLLYTLFSSFSCNSHRGLRSLHATYCRCCPSGAAVPSIYAPSDLFTFPNHRFLSTLAIYATNRGLFATVFHILFRA